MQLITVLSVATSMVATASARSAVTLNKECDTSKPLARIHNRCAYPVNLWSVYKGDGCPSDEMVTLKPGETYQENYADPKGGDVGVSIKISKSEECKGNDITQLEYFIQKNSPGFNYNYLDVSYVDCPSNSADCPTRQEGYYLVAGAQTGAVKASAANTWCPVMSCTDPASCNKISYVLPDDVQTKTCEPEENMDFYMCGGEAPGEESEAPSSAAPKPSAPAATSSKQAPAEAKPSSSAAAVSSKDSYETEFKVAAAAVTPAPQVNNQKIKTEVVYVTEYEVVNAKRHAHGHARRHQAFNA